ncbi:MAG: DapH/DapD/GlmU-related protein [Bacteroidales bacterium]|nr:DapH/DapD/GlmU-related protein [Bacteroidales bacterium]
MERVLIRIKDFFHKPSAAELKRRKAVEDYDYLRRHGVETELGYVSLIGKPHIGRINGARIIIGKGVVIVSDTQTNSAGINHPTFISAEAPGAVIKIEDGVGISGASIVTCSSITIGEQTMLGANVNIYGTDFHCLKAEDRLHQTNGTASAPTAPITIGKRCWLASNVTVLKGVTIGDEAVVGAMSLVNKNIPDKTVAAGVPAKVIREIG